jgi:hypothetical protein
MILQSEFFLPIWILLLSPVGILSANLDTAASPIGTLNATLFSVPNHWSDAKFTKMAVESVEAVIKTQIYKAANIYITYIYNSFTLCRSPISLNKTNKIESIFFLSLNSYQILFKKKLYLIRIFEWAFVLLSCCVPNVRCSHCIVCIV